MVDECVYELSGVLNNYINRVFIGVAGGIMTVCVNNAVIQRQFYGQTVTAATLSGTGRIMTMYCRVGDFEPLPAYPAMYEQIVDERRTV